MSSLTLPDTPPEEVLVAAGEAHDLVREDRADDYRTLCDAPVMVAGDAALAVSGWRNLMPVQRSSSGCSALERLRNKQC